MKQTDLPPLPLVETVSPKACSVVKSYLAIASDLPDDQRHRLSYHLQHCASCSQEWRLLSSVTNMVSRVEASQPSSRVDQAVMLAIAASGRQQIHRRQRASLSQGRFITAIAACIGAIAIAAFLLVFNLQSHFQLPANLSWNSYVLYHSQMMTASDGSQYHIQTYHNMATDQMNVETSKGNEVDVEVVSDTHQTLGMDTMHHVAQWDATKWMSDDSLFDLPQLRADLQSGKAIYLGTDTFQGKSVYRIRTAQGMILLLDHNYMPVNVLETNGKQAAQPMYEQVSWLAPTKVPNSMWQMDVPQGYKMGQLPTRPTLQ